MYEKLNDNLSTFFEKDKRYVLCMKMMKSLENKKARELNEKYNKKVSELEKENELLKTTFGNFLNYITKIVQTQITSSEEHLYNSFKSKVEGLLKKNDILKDEEEREKFVDIEKHDS